MAACQEAGHSTHTHANHWGQVHANMATQQKLVCLKDFEEFAKESMPDYAYLYYSDGANDEITLDDNIKAFNRYKLLPRVLRDVSTRDLHTTILGHRIDFPVGISPSAMQKLAHPEGENAVVKAATMMNIPYTLSHYSTSSLEEVVQSSPVGLKFFQLYIAKDHQITKKLVHKAERLGYKALVVTVDGTVLGKKYKNSKLTWELPSHLGTPIMTDSDVGTLKDYKSYIKDDSITWETVKWLKSYTSLPVILKGILSGADAALAAECGVAGVWVSNHGGRQLDTVPATIDVLCSVVRAVAGRCEVYLDGGVRHGTDVLKAIALGANAVFIGRPALYGLAYNGEDGVKQVLGILKEEFSTAMALSGCASLSDIKPELVIHDSQLSRL